MEREEIEKKIKEVVEQYQKTVVVSTKLVGVLEYLHGELRGIENEGKVEADKGESAA